MKRVLYVFANCFAGIVLILLVLDPTRPLAPIFNAAGALPLQATDKFRLE